MRDKIFSGQNSKSISLPDPSDKVTKNLEEKRIEGNYAIEGELYTVHHNTQ